jgi:hypothetical protein
MSKIIDIEATYSKLKSNWNEELPILGDCKAFDCIEQNESIILPYEEEEELSRRYIE